MLYPCFTPNRSDNGALHRAKVADHSRQAVKRDGNVAWRQRDTVLCPRRVTLHGRFIVTTEC